MREIKTCWFDINIWARGGKSASVQECHRGGDTKRGRTGEQERNKEQNNERLNESKRSRKRGPGGKHNKKITIYNIVGSGKIVPLILSLGLYTCVFVLPLQMFFFFFKFV